MKQPFSESDLQAIFKTNTRRASIVTSRESSTLEFKESFSTDVLNRCMKTIAGFANKEGGYIVFGIMDSPHELKGLDEKNEGRFDEMDPARLTESLNNHFDPEIRIEMHKHFFRKKIFGIMYVFPVIQKPVICKKSEGNNLRESAIYYRYRGQSREIKYADLRSILDTEKEKVNPQWMRVVRQLGDGGVAKTALLNLQSGKMTGANTTLFVDEELLEKIKFVQEGSFVETGGDPALKVVGDVKTVVGAQTIVLEGTRPRSITIDDILTGFMSQEEVQSPEEYIRQLCYQASGNLPIYYYIASAEFSIDDAISFINEVPKKSQAKTLLLKRLSQHESLYVKISTTALLPSRKKMEYQKALIRKSLEIPSAVSELKLCLSAIRGLNRKEIETNRDYILDRLFQIYTKCFNDKEYSDIPQWFRYAISRVDEALYMPEEE